MVDVYTVLKDCFILEATKDTNSVLKGQVNKQHFNTQTRIFRAFSHISK